MGSLHAPLLCTQAMARECAAMTSGRPNTAVPALLLPLLLLVVVVEAGHSRPSGGPRREEKLSA